MIEWWVAALWSSVFRSWDADLLFLLGHSGREIMIVENTRLHEKREILSILPTTQHKVTTHKVAPLLCFYSLLQQSETSREQGQVCSPCTALMPSFYFFLLCSRCFPLWFASHLPPFLAVTPSLHLHRFELSGTSANWFKYTSALLQNEMTGRTPCPQKLHETWKGFLGS